MNQKMKADFPLCKDIEPCSDCPNNMLCASVAKEVYGDTEVKPLALNHEVIKKLLDKYKDRVERARRL